MSAPTRESARPAACTVPRTKTFERFGLVSLGADQFGLVGGGKNAWAVLTFHLANGKLLWKKLGGGKGQLLDVPFHDAQGVQLPLARKGRTFLETLDPATFAPLSSCTEL